jgi:hypothetical protein
LIIAIDGGLNTLLLGVEIVLVGESLIMSLWPLLIRRCHPDRPRTPCRA